MSRALLIALVLTGSLPVSYQLQRPNGGGSAALLFSAALTGPTGCQSNLSADTGQTISVTRASVALVDTAGGVTSCSANQARVTTSGLESEVARTNIINHASQFDSWGNDGATIVTVTADNTTAPDGTTTADLVSDGSVTATHRVYNGTGSLTAGVYAMSVYAKYKDIRYMNLGDGAGTFSTTFDLSTASFAAMGNGTPTYEITSVGNGWYRYTVTGSLAAGNNFIIVKICDSSVTIGSSCVPAGKGAWLWRGQVEAAPSVNYPTSAIDTTSTSASRSADVFSVANPLHDADVAWGLSATAVLTNTRTWLQNGASAYLIAVGSSAAANTAHLYIDSSARPVCTVYDNSGTALTLTGTALSSGSHKVICTDSSGTMAMYVDGSSVGSSSGTGTGVITTQPATVYFGSLNGTLGLGGYISNVAVNNSADQTVL